jgi:hypothetical protein
VIKMISEEQLGVCKRFSAAPLVSSPDEKIGVSQSALDRVQPINGLRHPKGDGTTGWFVWGGEELESGDGFFLPLHVLHLEFSLREVLPYLALPPGWRFLIGPDYEDVWFDETLLSA